MPPSRWDKGVMMTNYSPKPVTHQGIEFQTIGNVGLFNASLTGFLCSRKCPAAKILEAHETCKAWATDPDRTIISGFHSPVEQECLRLLLQGQANIVYFPAREIEHLRIRREWRPALDQGRMLILTLASFKTRHMSAAETQKRNDTIASLADDLYIPYTTAGGHLAQVIGRQGARRSAPVTAVRSTKRDMGIE